MSTNTSISPIAARVEGWGMAVGGDAQVVQPTTIDGIRGALALAQAHGWQVALRGTGCSYGDASCGTGKLVIDLTRFNRILDFDRTSGLIRVEAGATIGDIWQYALPLGWWPPVVSGTMAPTLGGAAAMNIHGKNCWRAGPIGDHIRTLKILTVDGQERTLADDDPLFSAIISGFGELAVITEVTLQLKHIYAGDMDVDALCGGNWAEIFQIFREWQDKSDYLVGWIDAFATGNAAGRGLVHMAHQLPQGAVADPSPRMTVAAQSLPSRLFGIIPKSWMWVLFWPFANNLGWRLICMAKYWSARLLEHGKRYRQGHAAFHFLLDYVPNWKWAYKPHGLIQHQIFVPRDAAEQVFGQVFAIEQKYGMPSWLAVMKRHRADRFLLSHGLDGYSLAQDFAVTPGNRAKLWEMCHEIERLVLAAGGRFYFAKDLTVEPETVAKAWPRDSLERFRALRAELDPKGVLSTDLYERAVKPALDKLG